MEAEIVTARKRLEQLPNTFRELDNGTKTDQEVEDIIAEARLQIDSLRSSLHEIAVVASGVEPPR